MHWIKGFVIWSGRRLPAVPGEPEVSGFLSHLASERNVVAATQKQALATFSFQKYGMVQGEVALVSADSADQSAAPATQGPAKSAGEPLVYRTLVNLEDQFLQVGGEKFRHAPGMQVTAEIHPGTRNVLEYLLSPVRKAFHKSARER